MQINKIEVKNISHYARGSEETPCYNATVYINGKKSIEVSNDGHGGCDRQDTYPNIEERGLVQQANEWCIKTYGKKTHKYMSNGEEKSFEIEMDLEHVCQDALYDWLDAKELKKELKKNYVCVEKDKMKDEEFLVTWKRKGNHTDDYFKNFLKTDYPHMVEKCLNFMPFNQALKLFKEYT
jgi:hypothetical protein|tara:strand:- start:44 stop:583 length:540 start_codon:yes stop_codon:yes gene_type:complete